MKRILATILAFVYLSTSMGATLHFHYCMGKLVSWGLLDHEDKDCTFCGMPKKASDKNYHATTNGCCKDEHQLIKTDKDQKVTQAEYQLVAFHPESTPVYHLLLSDIAITPLIIEHPAVNGPPLISRVPVFLLNCTFRI